MRVHRPHPGAAAAMWARVALLALLCTSLATVHG
jgi:hypothetical protein